VPTMLKNTSKIDINKNWWSY